MRQAPSQKYLALIFFLICFCASANYFYMDKKYADVLTANNICASWHMDEAQNAPPELIKFAVTSGIIKSDNAKSKTEFLFPTEVIKFSPDGNFDYIWMKSPSQIGNIQGKWRVENSTLIFTFVDDKYPTVYAKDSELRYYIINIANTAATSLKFKGASYPVITNIMPSSNNPIKDFEAIASRIGLSSANK